MPIRVQCGLRIVGTIMGAGFGWLQPLQEPVAGLHGLLVCVRGIGLGRVALGDKLRMQHGRAPMRGRQPPQHPHRQSHRENGRGEDGAMSGTAPPFLLTYWRRARRMTVSNDGVYGPGAFTAPAFPRPDCQGTVPSGRSQPTAHTRCGIVRRSGHRRSESCRRALRRDRPKRGTSYHGSA